ncbi:L,D-transpeptidase family protein [Croceicoccus hydrothermalis]|uniref:L,D-transpeptidase family protein n=1 Tax=Croceicoccus hydrothermalis TaxID=2867964 RepID=UPI0023BACF0C|nr:L,D-transpeptidase family protein [Croceicoccus hydrothermalis]
MRLSPATLAFPLALALVACGSEAETPEPQPTQSEAAVDDNDADAMASNDPAPGETQAKQYPDSEERPTMQLQVVLDRLAFSPGVIDGKMGLSTRNAIEGFQMANDLEPTGEMNDETRAALAEYDNIAATRVVTIPEEFAVGRFEPVPDDPAEQAQMQRLGYASLEEKLAERFHTTVETLRMLNPDGRPAGADMLGASATQRFNDGDAAESGSAPKATPSASASALPGAREDAENANGSAFAAGQKIRVPNIGADFMDRRAKLDDEWRSTLRMLGVGTEQPDAARIVVDESEKTLVAYNDSDEVIATFTVTSGSSNDPLPIGDWKIDGVAHNPPFAYDPDLFWDVPDSEQDRQLPPGPNGPVGVVWIDLSKEHYGIHGTSAPETIGRAQSHGCVRLTNWDAARLAEMVSGSTKVVFQK